MTAPRYHDALVGMCKAHIPSDRDEPDAPGRRRSPRRMTADDFGMGNRAHDPEPGAPQTARSAGMGPPWADFADAFDLASLDRARNRHLRRRAMDAVDHLIALLDALDAETEDREPDDDDEPDVDGEPTFGAPENHPGVFHIDMDQRHHVGRRHHPLGDQTHWACGASHDGEEDDPPEEDDPGEENGDLDDDGLFRGEGDDADDEPSLSVVEWQGHGDNWRLSGPQTVGDQLVDVEAVNEDGDPGAEPWWQRPAHPQDAARAL